VDEVLAEALPSSAGVAEQFATLAQQLQQLQTVSQAASDSTKDNTRAVEANTTSQGGQGESILSTIGQALPGVGGFGLGVGLSPLITGLARLFGGGGEASAPPPLVRFALPPAVNVSAGVSDAAPGEAFAVDYGQGNQPRPAVSTTQVTVQVQAMDSQSFLDRRNDIALAVRQAMLESSVLNDVIRET
jgi:hypothetical protein